MIASRLLLLALATAVTALVVATGLAVADARRPDPRTAPAAAQVAITPATDRTGPVAVLADWDRRRSAAWAAGDRAALAGLYAPGSRAGRADVAMLGRWTRRGLRVTGLRMQVRDVAAVRVGPGRRALVVTDRLAGGEAVGPGTREPLPRDGWSTRRIVLEHAGGRWRVATVRPARP